MPIIGGPTPASGSANTFRVNVKDYGATGDGVTDDAAAIRVAMAAMNAANGYELFFPPGIYIVGTPLVFDGTSEVTVRGQGCGRLQANGAYHSNPVGRTEIRYTGTGSSSAISAKNSTGFRVTGIWFRYNQSGFTGYMIDVSSTDTNPTIAHTIEECNFTSTGASSCAGFICFDGVICSTVDRCAFYGAKNGIVGRKAAGGSGFSNANLYRDLLFWGGFAESSFRNPGLGATMHNVTFEPSGTPQILCDVGPNQAVSMFGGGFYDNTSGTASLVKSTVACAAWVFEGVFVDLSASRVFIDMTNTNGLSIRGCRIGAPGGGTPNVFTPGQTITNLDFAANAVISPAVDNHAAVAG